MTAPIARINIALVDDHQSFLDVVGLLLEDWKFNVIIKALNGVALFVELETKKPDIILLDVEMPYMDGIQSLIKLRKEYPDIKVIIFSHYQHMDFVIHCINLGAHSYLPKTMDSDEVHRAIMMVHEHGCYYSPFVYGKLNSFTTD